MRDDRHNGWGGLAGDRQLPAPAGSAVTPFFSDQASWAMPGRLPQEPPNRVKTRRSRRRRYSPKVAVPAHVSTHAGRLIGDREARGIMGTVQVCVGIGDAEQGVPVEGGGAA